MSLKEPKTVAGAAAAPDHSSGLRYAQQAPAGSRATCRSNHRAVLGDLRQTVRTGAGGHPGAHGGCQRAI